VRSLEMSLDEILPCYDVAERHQRLVPAPAEGTFQAFCGLTPAEIPLATLLVAVRSLPALLVGRRGPSLRLREPMLDQFLEAGFAVLGHQPGREIAVEVIRTMASRLFRIFGSGTSRTSTLLRSAQVLALTRPLRSRARSPAAVAPDAAGTPCGPACPTGRRRTGPPRRRPERRIPGRRAPRCSHRPGRARTGPCRRSRQNAKTSGAGLRIVVVALSSMDPPLREPRTADTEPISFARGACTAVSRSSTVIPATTPVTTTSRCRRRPPPSR
jgi:hypothetical protein